MSGHERHGRQGWQGRHGWHGGHLGTRVSALVDGQLGPGDERRALAHVAECTRCAHELAAAQAVRAALREATQAAPAASEELTRRLLEMAGPTAGRATDDAGPAKAAAGGPAPRRPGLPLPSTEARAWRPSLRTAAVLVGAAGGALTLGVLAVLGAAREVVPSRHPSDALALLSSVDDPAQSPAGSVAGTSGAGPSGEALHAWLRGQGWHSPVALPDGLDVVAVDHDEASDRLEIVLETPEGPVVVVQRHGRLDPSVLAVADVVRIEGVEVHVLSVEPWHGVWQCGDTVVDVVSVGPSDALRDLISAYPADGYDDGVPARIARGWDSLVGAWTP